MKRTVLPKTAVGALACALAASAFYAFFLARTSFVGPQGRVFVLFEDAMISMRYARNFAEGHGLVWNPGEARVEGYTNFLWTLLMSVPFRFGVSDEKASLCVMLVGVVLLFGTAGLTARIVAACTQVRGAPVAAFAGVLFSYPLVFWTLRGMEVGALAAVITGLVALAFSVDERPSVARWSAMAGLAALAVLLRSDAVVALAVVGLYVVVSTKGRARFAFAAIYGGALALTVAAHAMYRLRAYGDVVPNTYYLKLYGVPLLARVKRGLFVTLRTTGYELAVPLAVLAAAAPTVLGAGLTRNARRWVLLLGLVGAQAAYGVYVGGDAWEWMLYANRYVSVALPLLVAAVTLAFVELARAREESATEASTRGAGRRVAMVLAASAALLFGLEAFARLAPEQGVARTIVGSKSVLAVGLVLLVAAAAGTHARVREVVRRLVASLGVGLPRGAAAPAIVALLVWGSGLLLPYAGWAVRNAAQYADEERYARLGLVLREAAAGERIAVVAAGATPFFSRLPAEDLLGKNDAVVARRAPVGVFSPGHDKWDYAYSLGTRRPAVIVELADTTEDDERYVEALGYELLPSGVRIHQDAQRALRAALGAADREARR